MTICQKVTLCPGENVTFLSRFRYFLFRIFTEYY